MGSYNRAKICKIVSLFLLHHFHQLIGKNNIGLYRDNGLAIFDVISGPCLERYKKRLIARFQEHGLKITTQCILVQNDFLDATFNLKSKKYRSFRKPNDQPPHIHNQFNHPPVIKTQLSSMLSYRLSQLSCNFYLRV